MLFHKAGVWPSGPGFKVSNPATRCIFFSVAPSSTPLLYFVYSNTSLIYNICFQFLVLTLKSLIGGVVNFENALTFETGHAKKNTLIEETFLQERN